MNWNPTAYPGGTSLKPLKIDSIWVLTEHTIKDLLASLTILYCVGRDLMAAPFSSANFGSGCLKMLCFYFPGLRCFCLRIWGLGCFEDDIFFYFPGLLLSHLTSKWLEQLVFFRTSSDWGVPSVCFPSSWKRVGSLGGRGGRPGRKEGIPIHLRQWR